MSQFLSDVKVFP